MPAAPSQISPPETDKRAAQGYSDCTQLPPPASPSQRTGRVCDFLAGSEMHDDIQ